MGVFAGLFVALWAGHQVGDHWVQTDHQASAKGHRGNAGHWACVAHVATLTVTQVLYLTVLLLVTDTHVALWALALGLAVNAGTHYWADRRYTLRGLAELLERPCGKLTFYNNGGAYHLDQSWHVAWLFVAALVMTAGA